jgi:exopolysaccharide biosynthesis polyprenyl glycosylphosphotransferase
LQARFMIMATTVHDQDTLTLKSKLTAPTRVQLGGEPAFGTAETFERLVTAVEVVLDFLAVLLGGLVLERSYINSLVGIGEGTRVWHLVLAASITAVFMLERSGAYRRGSSLLRVKETERAIKVVSQLWVLAVVSCIAVRQYSAIKSVTAGAFFAFVLLISEKHLLYIAVRLLHSMGKGVRRVVIVGAGYTGRRVFAALLRSPKLGLDPVVVVDRDPNLAGRKIFEPWYRRERSVEVQTRSITAEFLRKQRAGAVVVAVPSISNEQLSAIMAEALEANVLAAFVPNRSLLSDAWIEHANIDGLLISSLGQVKEQPLYSIFKRVFDIFIAAIALVITLPVTTLIAALIKAGSAGPAIFVQQRVGLNGKLFNVYKFRTMYADAPPYSYSPQTPSDQRITKFGRFLRRTSLDELPQIFNVLKGEMSLVGPRPEMPFIVEQYQPHHWVRLRVKPGITGLWQLSADRAFLIHENLDYDLYYIRNQGFFMDLAILLHTFFFAMRGI